MARLLTLLMLGACDSSEREPADAGLDDPDSGDADDGPTPDADAVDDDQDADASEGDQEDAKPPVDPGCMRQSGPIVTPWADGVEPVPLEALSYAPNGLRIGTERVEARTRDGELIPCGGVGQSSYGCMDSAGLEEIIVHMAGKTWTLPAMCTIDPREDRVTLVLDDPPACVADGTIVVEGDLLGYDPSLAPAAVHLEGPTQTFEDFSASRFETSFVPRIACSVTNGHYACPTLGFRGSADHAIVAGGARTQVSLPVEDCMATTVADLDIACPDVPQGFLVKVPPYLPGDRSFSVRASYEGGASYECDQGLLHRDTFVGTGVEYVEAHFLCPPAPGNAHGRGRYDVVAESLSRPEHIGNITDAFDACGVARAIVTVELRR